MIDKQTCKFISRILENLPREMSEDIMQGWIQNPEGLKKLLSGLVPPPEPEDPFEFFYHEEQKQIPGSRTCPQTFLGYVNGEVLEQHLKETGLISRALSLESEMVKEWLKKPHTCPNIVKYLRPLLWGSAQVREPGGEREVPFLHYLNELRNDGQWVQQTKVYWEPVNRNFDHPVLLAKTK